MRKAPERITASVDIEAVGKAFVKMGFVTVGTEGVPEPFEPAIYTRADISAAQVAEAYERGVRESLSRMLPNFDEDSRAKIIEAAYRNYKQMQRGVRGQIITEWDSIESHVVEATRAAILALIDYPTPAPDTQADALEQVRKEAALKALADMGQEFDADTAAAQVAAAYERAAKEADDYMEPHVANGIRALATDEQTDALEQVRKEAERAGYERGVREAASRATHAMKGYTHPIGKGDRYALGVQAGAVRAKDEILDLLDNPTPDEQSKAAQELAFRKAVSS